MATFWAIVALRTIFFATLVNGAFLAALYTLIGVADDVLDLSKFER